MNNDDVDYELLGKIVACIQETFEFSANAFEDLSLATDINRDLGIEGDDANELMPEFFERFSVNIENYDPYRYFVPEGYDLFSFRRGKERQGKIPIKLGMLYWAAKTKTWDPAILEQIDYSSMPLYTSTAEIPLPGYEIHSR
ncbi:hypothetical protein N018_02510 [Pseudomonas syringae CC1557]|uniref:DUF1493 family protein n=1 Tax=Pseudomonas syringae CC1557 TaxID=1357279 RepID=W0MKP5_PSESX|nr:DUF1493 family protein [Pseudomonas syringae]AHG39179.1 hypothetical protein N018_02510 [Pseudomonas syringae CC1557]